LKKWRKKSVRAATHVRVAIAVRVVMVKALRLVLVVVHPVALAVTRRLENNDAATETQKVSQRAERS
jgi:hypothetical protein